jgi:hypothetical protein
MARWLIVPLLWALSISTSSAQTFPPGYADLRHFWLGWLGSTHFFHDCGMLSDFESERAGVITVIVLGEAMKKAGRPLADDPYLEPDMDAEASRAAKTATSKGQCDLLKTDKKMMRTVFETSAQIHALLLGDKVPPMSGQKVR